MVFSLTNLGNGILSVAADSSWPGCLIEKVFRVMCRLAGKESHLLQTPIMEQEGGMGHVCFLFVPLILYYMDSESKTVATVFYLLQDPSISI